MAGISFAKARQIIRVARAKGRELELKPLSIVVLDEGGHVIAFEREDTASAGRFKVAEAKAYGCIMLGVAGTAQMARAEAQGYFMLAANGLYDGKILPVPGGVIIRNEKGRLRGAVGVTGDTSENDAAAASAGIEAAGFVAEI